MIDSCWNLLKMLVAWSVLLSKTVGASSQTTGTIMMPLGIWGRGSGDCSGECMGQVRAMLKLFVPINLKSIGNSLYSYSHQSCPCAAGMMRKIFQRL